MARRDNFTFRVNQSDRQNLKKLAKHLQRSQSDAIRVLVRETVAQLEPKQQPAPVGEGAHRGQQ